jgi:predicted nucleic acid-binding protein
MGLVLDSSVLIASERRQTAITTVLDGSRGKHGETELVLSAISVVEVEHGVYRASSFRQTEERPDNLDKIFSAIPVEPFTKEIGQLVARIDAEARKRGDVIPFSDLLIGGTALEMPRASAAFHRTA